MCVQQCMSTDTLVVIRKVSSIGKYNNVTNTNRANTFNKVMTDTC